MKDTRPARHPAREATRAHRVAESLPVCRLMTHCDPRPKTGRVRSTPPMSLTVIDSDAISSRRQPGSSSGCARQRSARGAETERRRAGMRVEPIAAAAAAAAAGAASAAVHAPAHAGLECQQPGRGRGKRRRALDAGLVGGCRADVGVDRSHPAGPCGVRSAVRPRIKDLEGPSDDLSVLLISTIPGEQLVIP
jgi:hypothetical protein